MFSVGRERVYWGKNGLNKEQIQILVGCKLREVYFVERKKNVTNVAVH